MYFILEGFGANITLMAHQSHEASDNIMELEEAIYNNQEEILQSYHKNIGNYEYELYDNDHYIGCLYKSNVLSIIIGDTMHENEFCKILYATVIHNRFDKIVPIFQIKQNHTHTGWNEEYLYEPIR